MSGPAIAADAAELQGRWVLVSIGGVPVAVSADVYFEVNGDRIEGYDGCNRFGGSLANGNVLIGQRYCDDDFVRLPLDLARPGEHLRQSVVAGDRLSLTFDDGRVVAVFRRLAAQ